jgi:hypothetical protein
VPAADPLRRAPAATLTWPQALAWRLARHLLEPLGTGSAADVVRALGAVPTQADSDLAVGLRRREHRPGDVARALEAGSLVNVFAFRGTTHLMTPEDAGVYLALRCASRMWELPSWQQYYGLAPADWPAFRAAVRDALTAGPLTRAELGAAVTARPEYRHLAGAFADDSLTLLKPLTWQGDMSLAPPRDGRTTFRLLASNHRWAGVPNLADAGPRAVEAYLRAYGPATPDHLRYWLGEGLGAGRGVRAWLAGLGERTAVVDFEGERRIVMRDDVDSLTAAASQNTVRLLPGHDQWVLGPGTKDEHVVPPGLRADVTRGANLVLAGGVVAATWRRAGDEIQVAAGAGSRVDPDALEGEVARLASVAGAVLRLATVS